MHNIQDRTNLSPRARIVSNDIKDDLFEDPQSSMPRLRSASTALEAITSRIANLGGDAKAAARKRQQTTSDAMLFKVKQDILMINPFLFRTFKERLVASHVYAPILVHGALLEFFNDLKIPDLQHELKQEALARNSLPIDNDLRDHFTSSFSSLEIASKRLRNNSVTATKSTATTAAITTAIYELSIIQEDMRLSPVDKQNISSPLGTVTKTIIEDPMDETYDSSDDEASVSSDSSSDEEASVSDSSSDEESIVSASTNASVSSYASFMSESGESQESERLEV
jgi:hypothetical protein